MNISSGSRRLGGPIVVLAALVVIPAPLLPPLGLTGAVQSALGVGFKAAYLVCALGLHAVLYGTLGVLTAFSVGPGETRRQRLLRLFLVPAGLVALAVAIRSVRLGHVPMLANAIVPMAACALGAVAGLLFRQHGWRPVALAAAILAAGVMWAWFPGAHADLRAATQANLTRMIAAAPALPAGDERFAALLQTAFAPSSAGDGGAAAADRNRAAILALGITLGHERLARHAGLDRESGMVREAVALRSGTTLRGRGDWARHYALSAALAVIENPFLSDAGGLIKEELDSLTRGSGFSFGDLAADRAGVRFARAATGSEDSARATRRRLEEGFSLDDYFPPVEDLPENLTTEQFRRDYGGVGSPRYREAVAGIEARLDRCAGLAPP